MGDHRPDICGSKEKPAGAGGEFRGREARSFVRSLYGTGGRAWIGKLTAAVAGPGDRVSVRLRAWADVSAQYEKINRSEIEDPAVQLEEPAWGDLVN